MKERETLVVGASVAKGVIHAQEHSRIKGWFL